MYAPNLGEPSAPIITWPLQVRDTHEWKKKHQAYVEKPIAIQHFPTDAQKGYRSVPRKTTKRWTDTVLEYRLMQEDNDKHLDARGKNIVRMLLTAYPRIDCVIPWYFLCSVP